MAKKTYTVDELNDPSVIDGLKNQFGELSRLDVGSTQKKYDPHEVPDENAEIENAVYCLIRKPTDKELSFAFSKLPNMLDAGKVILKACFLGGDPNILTDPAMMDSAALQCLEFLQVRQTKLVKL